jgi:hypothetical protein
MAAALAAVSLVLAACSSSPSKGGSRTPPTSTGRSSTNGSSAGGSSSGASANGDAVITPGAAREIVAPTMITNNRANATLDSSLLASYEAGSAFTLDNASYEADRAARFVPPASPFAVDLRDLGLVHQTSWPASFLAIGTQQTLVRNAPKGPTCGTLLDFERTSASSRWHIVLEPSVNANALPTPAKTAGGYEVAVSAARQREAGRLAGEVRAAFLSEETSGNLGPFAKSDFTGSCWELPDPRADVVQAEASGLSQRDLFSTVPRSTTAAFALSGGSTLVIFTLDTEDQVVETSPSDPITWTHPSLSKEPGAAWTYFLPTGYYSAVNEWGAIEIAVVLSPSGRSWSVVGSYSGITKLSGQKTKSAPSQAPSTTLAGFTS